MLNILVHDSISSGGLECFEREMFEVSSEVQDPDAILVRSTNLEDLQPGGRLKAIARAGAGVNNIPVDRMTAAGIPVFNAPGANANAVKELTLAGLFLAARNICQAYQYTQSLDVSADRMAAAVESGKKQFSGYELPGKVLGVVGLGAIGIEIANAAYALGMRVIGYDPEVTVGNAWRLDSRIERILDVEGLFSKADFISLHVPLTDSTRRMVDRQCLASIRRGAVLLNFARGGLVDEEAVVASIEAGGLAAYVTDFPSAAYRGHKRIIALPHLGASTVEAQENCAVMAAEQIRRFLIYGEIKNSVNFPETLTPPYKDGWRITIINDNTPGMIQKMTRVIAKEKNNIKDLINKSREGVAYTLIDVDDMVSDDMIRILRKIPGVRMARLCMCCHE